MIYEIYIKCHDDKYTPSSSVHHDITHGQGPNTFRTKSRQLFPYRVPEHHYDLQKLTHSLHQLNSYVKNNKQNNTYLATKILFSHGKAQTRKFLHRTKQLFGDKVQTLKKKKIMASAPNSVYNSRQGSKQRKVEKSSPKNEQLYFETYRPDFTIRNNRQKPQIRQQRRKTMGLQQADLLNYENSRRGLEATSKRKERKNNQKDFKKLNMKGFAAKISATLQSRQKVSTKTLARLMNLNVKCLGDGSLRKRCA